MIGEKKSLVYTKMVNFEENYFDKLDDVNTYLSTEQDYIIGKIYKKGLRYNTNNAIIPYSFVGPENLFEKSIKTARQMTIRLNKVQNHGSKKIDLDNSPKVYSPPTLKIVDNNELNKIYDKIKSIEKKSNINDFVINIPKQMKKTLEIQENSFINLSKFEKNHEKICNYLCEKTKKSEETLLMNKSSNNRLKTEISDIIEKKNREIKNNGINEWILSLRRGLGNEDNINKFSYINVGKDSSPVYTMINENFHKTTEFISSPFKKKFLPKIDLVSKMKFFSNGEIKNNISLETIKHREDLKIEGKNLIEEEMSGIKKMKGRKIMYIKTQDETDEDIHIENYKMH